MRVNTWQYARKDVIKAFQIGKAVAVILLIKYLPKTKKFGCVCRGDLTSLFFSKVVKY